MMLSTVYITGEYPSRYRALVWRFLLKLPENASAFSELGTFIDWPVAVVTVVLSDTHTLTHIHSEARRAPGVRGSSRGVPDQITKTLPPVTIAT